MHDMLRSKSWTDFLDAYFYDKNGIKLQKV